MMRASTGIKAKRKKDEGFVPHPYLDPKGNTRGLYSIGYGHQIQPGEKARLMSSTWTEGQASAQFDIDSMVVENAINRNLIRPVTQNQFDALYQFGYNCGIGAMGNIAKIWNTTNDSIQVKAHIKMYDHVTISPATSTAAKVTKVDSALSVLREYEANLWDGEINFTEKKNG